MVVVLNAKLDWAEKVFTPTLNLYLCVCFGKKMIGMFVKRPKRSSIPGSFVVFYSCLFAITHLPIVVLVRKLNGFILPDYSVSYRF